MPDVAGGATSYEVGRVLALMAAHARQFPTGIWGQAYRSAATASLVHIPGRQGPWSDDAFVTKYSGLRAAIVDASPSGEGQSIAEAVTGLGTILERVQRTETAF